MRILIVEDNLGDVKLFEEAIGNWNEKVDIIVFPEVDKALQYLYRIKVENIQNLPQLIFLDLNMPRIDGRALLRLLKADETLRLLPTLVFSSSDSQRDVWEAYGLGATSFILKPYSFAEYQIIMNSLLHFWFDVVRHPLQNG